MDKEGTQIQATFYNDAATKWNSELEEGLIYTMKNGQVKMANKRYTTIPHDHCLSFDQYAAIDKVKDDRQMANFQGCAYSFKSLKEVQEAK
jgi:replication factor A1